MSRAGTIPGDTASGRNARVPRPRRGGASRKCVLRTAGGTTAVPAGVTSP